MFTVLVLTFVAFVVPYRLGFSEIDGPAWVWTYQAIDFVFFVDIILTFFSSIQENESSQEITDFKKIATAYFKSWFFFDVISIIPIDYFINQANYNQLFQLTKIGKLYKLVRMFRLAKLLKLLKKKRNFVSKMSEKLHLTNGQDRLIILTIFCFFFLHLAGCMYVLLSDLEDTRTRYYTKFLPLEDHELYIISTYFIMTTIATVGYGDTTPTTAVEQIFAMFVMIVGVTFFTLLSGALASIMTTYDQTSLERKEKMLFLNTIKVKSKISGELYDQIK